MTAKQGTAWAIAGLLVAGIVVALLLGWRPLGADGVHELDAGDDGTVVEVEVGEEVVVSLEGNATTGYSWQVTAVDSAVLSPRGDPDYESSSDAAGAGGTYTFHFDALGAGGDRGGAAVLPHLGRAVRDGGVLHLHRSGRLRGRRPGAGGGRPPGRRPRAIS